MGRVMLVLTIVITIVLKKGIVDYYKSAISQ